MTDDETFAEALRGAVRDMEPPPVPREEMWARIEQARREAAPAASPALPHRRTRWLRWSLPLAAALALGVALGRYTAAQRDAQPAFVDASPSPGAAAEPALAYMVAAAQHLARTEELLSALPAEARDTAAAGVAAWASDLLTNTRLLMDSPASVDPQLAALLRDLELILAQIAALPPAAPAAELQLIEDGIERNDMIGRLRAATNERPIFGT
jgi:hypothetical protein